jgi:hypothetical protein
VHEFGSQTCSKANCVTDMTTMSNHLSKRYQLTAILHQTQKWRRRSIRRFAERTYHNTTVTSMMLKSQTASGISTTRSTSTHSTGKRETQGPPTSAWTLARMRLSVLSISLRTRTPVCWNRHGPHTCIRAGSTSGSRTIKRILCARLASIMTSRRVCWG